jgi:hypothetical protein
LVGQTDHIPQIFIRLSTDGRYLHPAHETERNPGTVFLYLMDLLLQPGVECSHETATKPGLAGATDHWKQAYPQNGGFDWSEVAKEEEGATDAPQVAFWLDLHMLATNPEWHAWVLAMLPAVFAFTLLDTPYVYPGDDQPMACFQTTEWQDPLSRSTDRQRRWVKIEEGKWRQPGASVETHGEPDRGQEEAEEDADEAARTLHDVDANCTSMVVPDDHPSCVTPPVGGSDQGDCDSSNSDDGDSDSDADPATGDGDQVMGDSDWNWELYHRPCARPPAPTEGGAWA